MGDPGTGRSASLRTYLLAGGLGFVAALLSVYGSWPAAVSAQMPRVAVLIALTLAFFAGEQLLMNVEFRRQAHSLTLAGVPLIIGVLVAPLQDVVLARLVGAGLALAAQRISIDKIVYNCASYAFEAAVDALLLYLLLGPGSQLDLRTAVTVLVVVVLCDQLMSALVLMVIHWHGGSMTRNDIRDVLLPAFTLAVVSTAMALGVLLLARFGALGVGVAVVFASIAFVGYRGYLQTTRRHQRLELLHEFVNGGVGAESLDEVTRELLGRIRTLLRVGAVELLLLNERPAADGTVAPGAATDVELPVDASGTDVSPARRPTQCITRITDHEVDGFSISDEETPLDWVTIRAIDHAQPLLAPRSSKDRAVRQWTSERNCRDAIVVALPVSSGFVGTLTVSNRLGETATFTHDDLTLLQTLTGHLTVAAGSARLVERLGYDATHDSLTGLANRAYLSRQIALPRSSPDVTACVLLLDLDRFKEVNDGLGHSAGDQLLTIVGSRLCSFLPADATVARLGGDEFAALLPALVGGSEAAVELGEQLAAYLACPVAIDEAMLIPDVSIGLALAGPHVLTTDLLRQADTAMYCAKVSDSTVALYHSEMDRGRVENLALLADLRLALRDHPEQIAVYYQPKIDLVTRAVVSAEALVRWNHPSLGILSPDRFIPLAETAGLIERFTPLVLDAALEQCRRWREHGDISVAVNLSARNVGDCTLAERVSRALANAGVPASSLILEITESSIIADPVQSQTVLSDLAALGVTISLDDFGTGYSSLSYLQRLPVQEVKIDRSFVQGLTSDNPRPSRALIGSIAGLGANLGLRVVAEGVEEWPVLDELRELGCHVAQGYVIARPAPADAFAHWLERHLATHAIALGQTLTLVAN